MIIKMSSKLFLLLQYMALFSVLLCQLEPRITESNSTIIRCIDEEKEALLTFEQSPVDEYGALSSWGREGDKRNCCKWRGVCCNNTTSHFKVLNLRSSNDENARRKILKDTISSALLLCLNCMIYGLHFNLSTSIENLISITTTSLLLQYTLPF